MFVGAVVLLVSSFQIITGSQLVVPASVKSWSVAVVSGSAYVNGAGPMPVGVSLNGGSYDGRFISANPLVVGATGTLASPSNVIVMWET